MLISLTFCGIYQELRNLRQLAIFASCATRGTANVPTNFTLQVFVRGIDGSLVSGIHLLFGTSSKVCLCNPGTYRHEIVRLFSAQFGLVMIYCFCSNFLLNQKKKILAAIFWTFFQKCFTHFSEKYCSELSFKSSHSHRENKN